MDDSYEATAHSFLVRIWLEERHVVESTWRGHVTHVPDGVRCYFKELEEIVTFVEKYLEGVGNALPSNRSENDE